MKAVKESFGRPARVFQDNYPFSQAGQRRVTRTTPLLTFRSNRDRQNQRLYEAIALTIDFTKSNPRSGTCLHNL